MGAQEKKYLLHIGVSIRVCVGKNSSVLPAARILQFQDLLSVLMIQRALTSCFISVQIYFKLKSQGHRDLLRMCQTFVPVTVSSNQFYRASVI